MASTYKALVSTAIGQSEVQDLPVPKLRERYALVRTKAVALNPTDWSTIYAEDGLQVGKKIGCDFAGVVEEVGPGVSEFVRGDQVCGMAYSAKDIEHGAFGEYVLTPVEKLGPLVIKKPNSLSFEEAATLGVGLTTVGQGLYQWLQLPLPSSALSKSIPILINGGSTTTGILGIQLAKLSGLRVLATGSPHNFAYLKSLGADAVYDYHIDPDTLAAQIRSDTANALTLAWDCSTSAASTRLCALSLSSQPSVPSYEVQYEKPRYAALSYFDPAVPKALNPAIADVGVTMAYTALGERVERYGGVWEASREDAEFARMFWKIGRALVGEGRVRVARLEVNRGGKGLEGVKFGLEELKEGNVSAVKLVYTF